MRATLDLTGRRFGRLTAVRRVEPIRDGTFFDQKQYSFWYCACDCGSDAHVRTGDLTNNRIKSCGCLRREYYARKKAPPGTIDNGGPAS